MHFTYIKVMCYTRRTPCLCSARPPHPTIYFSCVLYVNKALCSPHRKSDVTVPRLLAVIRNIGSFEIFLVIFYVLFFYDLQLVSSSWLILQEQNKITAFFHNIHFVRAEIESILYSEDKKKSTHRNSKKLKTNVSEK